MTTNIIHQQTDSSLFTPRQRKASFMLLGLYTLYVLWVYSGVGSFIFSANYDSWRIQQIILLLCTGILGFFIPTPTFNKKIIMALSAILIIASISASLSPSPTRAFTDLALYFSLFLSTVIVASAWHITGRPIWLITILALAPILTIMWLPFNILSIMQQGKTLWVWHGQFINIRYFDDTLLPAMFMLWYVIVEGKSSRTIKVLLSVIASLYFLALLLDGARAVLLSTTVALIIAGALNHKKLNFSYLYIVLSWVLAFVLKMLVPTGQILSIARQTSSGRVEMWQNTLQYWLSSPKMFLLGSGGNPEVGYWTNHQTKLLMHPHNIGLQWLVEWGLAGGISLGLLTFLYFKTIKKHQHISLLVLAGMISLALNAFISGSWVYPQSQITGLLLLSCATSYLVAQCTTIQMKQQVLPCILILLTITVILLNTNQVIDNLVSPPVITDGIPRLWMYFK